MHTVMRGLIMRSLLLILASLLIFPNIALPAPSLSPDDFVTTWKTDPGSTSITIPILRTGFDLCVDLDWNNDGVFDNFCLNGTTKPVTHDYGVAGTYTVRIGGFYDTIRFDGSGDRFKIISVDQWGTKQWKTMQAAFRGASNLEVLATDTPGFSDVTDMSYMFYGCSVANPDTSNWDTSAVTNMSFMFLNARAADPDTSNWDTSAVTDMSGMFYWASSANPDTSNWDTSAVTSMYDMFFYARSANPDTSNWDTSKVTDMWGMFESAYSANPDTSNWDTSSLRNTDRMFYGARSANPDTSAWDVSKLWSAEDMFGGVKLSTANYERLLVNWSAQALRTEVDFHGGNSTYCSSAAVAARDHMTSTFAWSITDGGQVCDPADDFVTTWRTDNPGPSNSTSITIPMVGGPYEVDWGDGAGFSESGLHDAVSHDYGTAGTYTIRIRGIYDSISFNNGGDKLKIISLDQWGTQRWRSMYAAFYGAANLEVPAVDTPDFSAVTSMHNMFWGAVKANPDATHWDTSSVTMMAGVFGLAEIAEPDVSNWDTSSVTNMAWMFTRAYRANPDVANWDTSKVTTMHGMFYWASSANPDVSGWDVSSLTNAEAMFANSMLSTANYDALLQNWSVQSLTSGVSFSAGDTTYCSDAAAAARNNMITTNGWTITDGGNYCPPPPPDSPLTAPDMTPETDTGISDSDDFTNNNRPSFFVDCSAVDNTITLYTDYPSPNIAVGSYICVTDGIEVASVSETLPAGVHNITYTDRDADGESGHSPSLVVTIDTIMASGFE